MPVTVSRPQNQTQRSAFMSKQTVTISTLPACPGIGEVDQAGGGFRCDAIVTQRPSRQRQSTMGVMMLAVGTAQIEIETEGVDEWRTDDRGLINDKFGEGSNARPGRERSAR
jgi:hypothetical protein